MADGPAVEPHHARQPRALARKVLLNLFLGSRPSQFVERKINASHRHGRSSISLQNATVASFLACFGSSFSG